MDIEDIKCYLPKYLSTEAQAKLFDDLSAFPSNIDQRLYTVIPNGDEIIFQGDGINELLVVNLPDDHTQPVPCIILSNTCDIDINNKRYLLPTIIYAPIVTIEKYCSLIRRLGVYPAESIESHLESIRKQRITSIFYLPCSTVLKQESMALLDKINNCSSDYIPRESLRERRIFSLSQYGHYLLLFKLSIHFTRIQERVDRIY